MWHTPFQSRNSQQTAEKRGRSALLKGYGFHVFSRRLKKGGKTVKWNTLIKKKDILYVIPCFLLFLIIFIMSVVILFAAIPQSLAAQVTMEIYQQEGRKAFGRKTSVDIFNDTKLGGKKLVHPFTKGSYTFAVYNNSNSNLLPYSLKISGVNPDEIPLVFSLRKNGEYVYGGERITNMLPLSEIKLSEINLGGKKTDMYIINWEWKTERDDIDTAIGRDGSQTYKLVLTATGTVPETDNIPPITSDSFSMLFWLVIMSASILALVSILIFYKRGDDDEDNKTVSENI